MLRRTYKVKGGDVNDFMVMQDFAYQSYTSSIVDAFLFERGYSKQKLTEKKVGFRKYCEEFVHLKELMFTQHFLLNLELLNTDKDNKRMRFRSRFFNVKNELCAMAILQLYWFDYNNENIIAAPRKVVEHFLG